MIGNGKIQLRVTNNFSLCYIVLAIILCSVLALVLFFINPTSESIRFAEVCNLIIFSAALIVSIRKQGVMSCTTLMIIAFFYFLLSRPILDLFGFSDIMYTSNVHAWYVISDETILTELRIFYVAGCATLLFLLTTSRRNRIQVIIVNRPELEEWSSVLLYFLALPAFYYRIVFALSFAGNSSYISSYIDDGTSSIWSLADIVFRCVIPIYLAANPKNFKTRPTIIIIIVYIVLSTVGGSRYRGFSIALFLAWFIFNILQKKISVKAIALIALTLFVLGYIATLLRGSFASLSIIDQLVSDSYPFNVVANAIDYYPSLPNTHHNLFILAGLMNFILRYFISPADFTSGRNYTMASASYSLDHKLTYTLNPNAFAAGRGIGSCVEIEMYFLAGFIGVFVLLYLYLLITNQIEKHSAKSTYAFVIFFWWFQAAVFSPRGGLFPSMVDVVVSITILAFLHLLTNRASNQRRIITNSINLPVSFSDNVIRKSSSKKPANFNVIDDGKGLNNDIALNESISDSMIESRFL